MDLIKIAEEAFATGKQHPSFKAGDTVTVAYRIVEGISACSDHRTWKGIFFIYFPLDFSAF